MSDDIKKCLECTLPESYCSGLCSDIQVKQENWNNVQQIIDEYNSGSTYKFIAKKYTISEATITRIAHQYNLTRRRTPNKINSR